MAFQHGFEPLSTGDRPGLLLRKARRGLCRRCYDRPDVRSRYPHTGCLKGLEFESSNDRDFYRHAPQEDPLGPAEGQEKVLRGGSWADCADVVTVTFRMSRGSRSWTEGAWGEHLAPNIGFRLCRTVVG